MAARRNTIAAVAMLPALWVAHQVAYRVAFPASEMRNHYLALTGHGWFGVMPFVAAAGLAAALLWGVASARSGRSRRCEVTIGVPSLAVVLYLAVELTERVAAGGHHGHVHLPTLLIGSLIAGVAAIGVTLLAELTRRIAVRASKRRLVTHRPVLSGLLYRAWCESHTWASTYRRGPPARA